MAEADTADTPVTADTVVTVGSYLVCRDATGIEDVCTVGTTYRVHSILSEDLIKLEEVQAPVFLYRFRETP